MNHKFNLNDQEYIIRIWDGENLGQVVAVDTETTIVPFTRTPLLCTFQAYGGGSSVFYVPKLKVKLFMDVHEESIKVMHNAPFDNDVIKKLTEDRKQIYDMYDKNLIRDTGILYRLFHLAAYGWVDRKTNLKRLSEKYCGIILEKDERRENFSQFLNSELKEIPTDYLEYGALDAIATLKLYYVLLGKIQSYDKFGTLLSHDIQVKGDLALKHIYKNGIKFDLSQRDEWLEGVDTQLEVCADILASYGWCRGQKGVKDKFAQIMEFMNIKLPTTKTGSISSTKEDLEPYISNPFVAAYIKFMELEKASGFVRDISSERIHPQYNLMVNTGRTSCSKPNFQQLPRVGGLREMFVAEEGKTFLITDYSTVELATLAQVTYDRFGKSVMRDKINEGEDLHKYYASVMHECSIDKISKDQRQMAKAPNFGFPGGLGVDTFITFAKGYDLDLTRDEAQEMKDVWYRAFPEMKDYMCNDIGHVYTLTGRRRGNTSYCPEKNTPFQGLAADGAKLAMYNMDKAGFKIVGFVHDEVICEVNLDEVDEKLQLQEKIMVESMQIVVPDVKIAVESEISPFYRK